MVLKSAREAFTILRSGTAFWFAGIIVSGLSVLQLWLSMNGMTFYADRLLILQALVFPFLMAGAYGALLSGDQGPASFFRSGKRWYFRILLPSVLIMAAIAITFLAILVPLMIVGYGLDSPLIPFVIFTVSFSVFFFTFFYDNAAVFEDRRVFDSIRRSIEFVLTNPFKTLSFYLLSITYAFIVVFAGIIVWSVLLASHLEPLIGMTAAQQQALTPGDLLVMIGSDGMAITLLLYFIGIVLVTSYLYAFKAAFFRRYAGVGASIETQTAVEGEVDEKGRWYKYS
jgi:hypothetical protein